MKRRRPRGMIGISDMKTVSLYCLLAVTVFTQSPLKRTTPASDVCSTSWRDVYDKVSGESFYVGSHKIAVSDDKRTGFIISIQASLRSSLILTIQVVEPAAGCIGDKAIVEILFRDGTRLRTASNSSFNCDGKVSFYFREVFGQGDVLEQLASKPIETLRVHAYKSSVQRDFSVGNSNDLMKQLSCINAVVSKDAKETAESLEKLKALEKGDDSIPVQAASQTGVPSYSLPSPPVGKTISGGVLNGKATSLPKPPYPPAARAVRASGAVSVQILIGVDGRVLSAEAVSGHPLLRPAAVSTARQAIFSPTTLNGEPVKVLGVLTFNFVP